MTNTVKSYGEPIEQLEIPGNFRLVSSKVRVRNRENVLVERYQEAEEITPNNSHVTVVYGRDKRLISYNRFAIGEVDLTLPIGNNVVDVALTTWQKVDPDYAAGLQFMRAENETRSYINEKKQEVKIPLVWVKFAHDNGSYNWVSVGPNNQVIELERESLWDYLRSRRKTEEWNYDNWVLAREGKGPQLKAPEALA